MVRTASEPPVVNQQNILTGPVGVVGGRIDLQDFEGTKDRRISSYAVKAQIKLFVTDEGKQIGVRAVAEEILGPRRSPGEDEGAFDGDIERRGMRFAVVVIVNSESPDVVSTWRERDDVAILLSEGEREVPYGLLGDEMETKRLGYDGGASAGVESIGKPCSVENVCGTFGTSTVNEERSICKRRKKKTESSVIMI